MSRDSWQAVRAVFLAAIMIISVFAAGIAFSGSAAAFINDIDSIDAENVTIEGDESTQDIKLVALDRNGDDNDSINISIQEGNGTNLNITGATLISDGRFGSDNVTVTTDNSGAIIVEIEGDVLTTTDLIVQATLDTSSANSGTVTYNANTDDAEVTGTFEVQSSSDSTAPSPTVDTDASSVSPTQTTVDETQEYTVDLTIDNVPNEAATVDIGIDGFDILDEDGNPVNDATIDYTADDVTDGTASFTTTLNATPESSLIDGGTVFVDEIRPEGGNQDIYNDQQTIGVISVQEAASTLIVDNDGTTKYKTIQAAVDNASSRDTIEVEPGTYDESVTIDVEGLTLEGPNVGLAGDSGNRGDEATITQGIQITADGVTVDGFDVTTDDADTSTNNGILLGTDAVPSDVTLTNNIVRDINGSGSGGDKSAANGINLQFNGAFEQTSTGVSITDNLITGITTRGGNSDEDAIGIQALPRGNDIENLRIVGNTIEDIQPSDAAGGDPRSEARAVSIATQFTDTPRDDSDRGDFGQVSGVVVENNNISGLNADFARAITLFEGSDGSGDTVGPVDFTITGNSISGVDSTGRFFDLALFVGEYSDFGDDHSVQNNDFDAAGIENFGDSDALSTSGNTFSGSTDAYYVSASNIDSVFDDNTFVPEVVVGNTAITRLPAEGEVLNVDQLASFRSVQTAVSEANPDDTISVGPGTFNESVTVDIEGLTLKGAGADVTVISGTGDGQGVNVSASDVTIRDMEVTGFFDGVQVTGTHSNITFGNIDSVGNDERGMRIQDADIEDLALDNVNFSNNGDRGVNIQSSASIVGLSITDSKFNNNNQGIAIFQNEDDPGEVNDVTISDTEFIDNTQKGIYTEKLSNAILDNITVDGITSDTYPVNNGIDINLKFDSYENITIRDSTVASVSEGDPLNGNPSASVAVTIKARGSSPDDASYTSTPAALDDVTIENVVIEDSFNGLRIGEFGKDYSDGGGPTNVDITDSTFQNNSGYHVEDVTDNLDLDDILSNQLNNEFDRVVTIENDAGNITGSSIFGSIQPAVDEASSGDTVSVSSDTYEESVEIRTPNITLESAAGTTNTKIEYDGEDKIPTVDIIASDVTVDGFTIERVGGNQFSQGVAVRATDGVQVSNNVITQSGDASQPVQGILVTDNNGDRSVTTDTVIGDNEISGFDHGIAISTQNTTSGGISGAFIDDNNTIQNNVIGIKISDFYDTDEEISATVTGNEISNNEDGIRVLDDDTGPAGTEPEGSANIGGFVVERNNIVNNTNSGITHEASADDNSIDASLNWWGNASGPNADSANDVEGDGTPGEGLVVQDPFLTTPIENISVDDVGDTKQFAQDVIAPADQDVTAVGFPGPVPQGYTVGDAFENVEGGAIFEYDREAGQFVPVNGSDEISALDAFVITQNSNISDEDTQVVIEYANSFSRQPSVTIGAGFNFIAAPKLGDSSVVLRAEKREVIYGTYGFPSDRSETALLRTERASDGFVQFAFGPSRDVVVTPYGGYLIFSEDSRQVLGAVRGGATADDVINTLELNQTAT